MDVEGDRAAVSIVGADLPSWSGRDGEVLEALQELTRLAVYRETGERSRLMLDISGTGPTSASELEELAAETRRRGARSPASRPSLEPMTPFERKVVHDAVAAAGLTSESEGVEPRRYVVVLPELSRPMTMFHVKRPPRPHVGAGGVSVRAAAAGRAVRRPAGHRRASSAA